MSVSSRNEAEHLVSSAGVKATLASAEMGMLLQQARARASERKLTGSQWRNARSAHQQELEAQYFAKHGRMDAVQAYRRKQELMKIVHRWFKLLDKDQGGFLDMDELEGPLTSAGLVFSRAQLEAMVSAVDADGSGEIDVDELFTVIESGLSEERKPERGGAAAGVKRSDRAPLSPSRSVARFGMPALGPGGVLASPSPSSPQHGGFDVQSPAAARPRGKTFETSDELAAAARAKAEEEALKDEGTSSMLIGRFINTIQSGAMGDPELLDLETLLSSYRRKLLLEGIKQQRIAVARPHKPPPHRVRTVIALEALNAAEEHAQAEAKSAAAAKARRLIRRRARLASPPKKPQGALLDDDGSRRKPPMSFEEAQRAGIVRHGDSSSVASGSEQSFAATPVRTSAGRPSLSSAQPPGRRGDSAQSEQAGSLEASPGVAVRPQTSPASPDAGGAGQTPGPRAAVGGGDPRAASPGSPPRPSKHARLRRMSIGAEPEALRPPAAEPTLVILDRHLRDRRAALRKAAETTLRAEAGATSIQMAQRTSLDDYEESRQRTRVKPIAAVLRTGLPASRADAPARSAMAARRDLFDAAQRRANVVAAIAKARRMRDTRRGRRGSVVLNSAAGDILPGAPPPERSQRHAPGPAGSMQPARRPRRQRRSSITAGLADIPPESPATSSYFAKSLLHRTVLEPPGRPPSAGATLQSADSVSSHIGYRCDASSHRGTKLEAALASSSRPASSGKSTSIRSHPFAASLAASPPGTQRLSVRDVGRGSQASPPSLTRLPSGHELSGGWEPSSTGSHLRLATRRL